MIRNIGNIKLEYLTISNYKELKSTMQDSYKDITYSRRRYPLAERITPVWNPQRQRERLIGIKEEVKSNSDYYIFCV